MTDKEPLSVAVARITGETLHRAADHVHRSSVDAGQTVMWLVGLASTLVALNVAQPAQMARVLVPHERRFVILLLITIAAGVLCKILALWGVTLTAVQLANVGTYLTGFAAGLKSFHPKALSDQWDRDDVIRMLQSEFGLDYSFLRTYKTPVEFCRQAYQAQFDIWTSSEAEMIEDVSKAVYFYTGQRLALNNPVPQAQPGAAPSIHWLARVANGLTSVVGLLFVIACGSFVAAMTILTSGVWYSAAR